jgi:hypothetical protein
VPEPGFEDPYGFQFIASDGGTPPEGGDSNTATVTVSQEYGPQVLFDFPLDTEPGWYAQGGWAFGQPTGGGSHSGDPTSGATGPNVYGYNLNGDYQNDLVPEYLQTTKLDLSEATGTRIEFQRWLGVSSGDRAALEISTDTVEWETVWENTSTVDESSWSLQSYDVSLLADGQPQVIFRWVMGPSNATTTYPGWNIDDVRIWGIGPVQGCLDAPGEVETLTFWSDKTTLDWMPPAELGGAVAPVYDVVRSNAGDDFTGNVTCIQADDGANTYAVDPEPPAVNTVFYYLVRAENECGPGSAGQDSGGVERPAYNCVEEPD